MIDPKKLSRLRRQSIGSSFMDIGVKMLQYGQDLYNGDVETGDLEKKVIEPARRLIEKWEGMQDVS